MNEIVVTTVTAIISSGVTGFFTWIFARKKYNSEVDNQLIANMKESLEFYKTLSDDNKDRLDEVLTQNREILEQNMELLKQNEELKKEVEALKVQVENLTKLNEANIKKSNKKS